MRFPDFYARLHAAGKGDTLGQALVLLGPHAIIRSSGRHGTSSFKLILIMLFVFIFNPTATHALARGAWVLGLEALGPGEEAHPEIEPRTESDADERSSSMAAGGGDRLMIFEDLILAILLIVLAIAAVRMRDLLAAVRPSSGVQPHDGRSLVRR